MMVQRPGLLWVLPAALAALAVTFALHSLRRSRVVRQLGGAAPVRRLTGIRLHRIPAVRYLLVAGAAAAVAGAAAGPQDPEPPVLEPGTPLDLIMAVDISGSMRANDMTPDRIGRARAFVNGVLAALPSERVGLVAFASHAYVLAPPTRDHAVLRQFVDALDPELLPGADRGSRPSKALRAAGDLLARRGTRDADAAVVLVTDGEAHEEETEIIRQAEELRENAVRVYAIGIGTQEGTTLRRLDSRGRRSEPFRDRNGTPVVSRLDHKFLARIARSGEGAYVQATGGDASVRRLLDLLGRAPPEDRGPTADPGWSTLAQRLGLLALILLLLDSGLEAAARWRQARARRSW